MFLKQCWLVFHSPVHLLQLQPVQILFLQGVIDLLVSLCLLNSPMSFSISKPQLMLPAKTRPSRFPPGFCPQEISQALDCIKKSLSSGNLSVHTVDHRDEKTIGPPLSSVCIVYTMHFVTQSLIWTCIVSFALSPLPFFLLPSALDRPPEKNHSKPSSKVLKKTDFQRQTFISIFLVSQRYQT